MYFAFQLLSESALFLTCLIDPSLAADQHPEDHSFEMGVKGLKGRVFFHHWYVSPLRM